MIKINGIFVNENAITSIAINEAEDTAYVFLSEVRDGDSVCLHVHGKDAVGYLDMYFGVQVTVVFDNDEEEDKGDEDVQERVRVVD